MSVAASLRFMRQYNRRLERLRLSTPNLTLSPELLTIEASDFVFGGEPNFARAADRRGVVLATWVADVSEPYPDFVARAKMGAQAMGAARLLIGGIPDLSRVVPPPVIRPPRPGAILLFDGRLHVGQIEALRIIQAHRFTALCAGRRFGKTTLSAALAADVALLGGTVGLYAPIYRLAAPLFDALTRTLAPLIKTKNRTSGEKSGAFLGRARLLLQPRHYRRMRIHEPGNDDDVERGDAPDYGRSTRARDLGLDASRHCGGQFLLESGARTIL
jgi:hypothetical protein